MGKIRWSHFSVVALLMVALIAAACGGGSSSPTPTPTSSTGSGTTPTPTSESDWDAIVAAAEREGLKVVTHPGSDYEAVIAEFKRAYPNIPVEHLGARPSEFTPRVLTEQANNRFEWDVWTTSTSNMNNVVKPEGGFTEIEPYLVLDEIKDPSNWHGGALMYTGDDKQILIHSLNISQGMRINRDVLAELGVELTSGEQLTDPRLSGMIGIRPLSGQHGSSLQFTGFLKEYGEDWVRQMLTPGHMVVNDNAGLLAQEIMNGALAVVIGAANEVIDDCFRAGGCTNVDVLPQSNYALARGIGVLRNPPHPNATKVFVNWFLSKEGQEAFVRAFAQTSTDGAHSLRVDVEPHNTPENLASVPDYNNLDRYSMQGTDYGAPDMERIQALWEEYY